MGSRLEIATDIPDARFFLLRPLYAADLDCCLQKGPKGRRPSGEEEEDHAHSSVRPVYLSVSPSSSHKLILFSHIASSESVEEEGGEGEAIINSTTSSGGEGEPPGLTD